jgi:Zn finger protein HypA/HybF involved in hydrogenase expression
LKTYKTITQIETFKEKLFCEECREEMVCTNMTYLSHPPRFEHECPKCGRKTTESDKYPRIVYKEIEVSHE